MKLKGIDGDPHKRWSMWFNSKQREEQMCIRDSNSSTPILYYNKDMFEKAGITEVPTSLEGILAIGDDLKTKGGAGEPLALSIYGWYFEQWLCKQGLSYADNGNGRDAAATAVEFDSNGGALNILNEWKALNDADVAPNVGRADVYKRQQG